MYLLMILYNIKNIRIKPMKQTTTLTIRVSPKFRDELNAYAKFKRITVAELTKRLLKREIRK